ncbi:unnamed protein product [Closterium sp. NIES-54]
MESPLGLPCPAFEGFEKRLDVEFTWKKAILSELKCKGLRSASRAALDAMLDDAQCTIVSKMSNEHLDAYVLSESSLFIFPTRAVIKTCGTTRLLNAIPKLLKIADEAGLEPARCRYSRGTFLFPEAQPSPHRSFDEEVVVLDGHFGGLKHRRAHVMGDVLGSRKWHVYVAGEVPAAVIQAGVGAVAAGSAGGSIVTVEVCMTDLGRSATKYFFKSNGYGDAADVTTHSGIGDLVPHSRIDDFNFDPCGYSMNGLDGEVTSTVHITPEDGFSYASFEVMGSVGVGAKGPLWQATGGDLDELVAKTARTFLPGRLTVAVHSSEVAAEGAVAGKAWTNLSAPRGYACAGSSCHMLPGGAAVSYVCFDSLEVAGCGSALRADMLLGNLLPSFDSFRSESSDYLASIDSSDDIIVPGESLEDKASPLAVSPAVSAAVAETEKLYGAKAAAVVADLAPSLIGASPAAIDAYIRACVTDGLDSAFYVMDAGVALQLHATWTQLMPRVQPFYAVKCNPDPALLSLLASTQSLPRFTAPTTLLADILKYNIGAMAPANNTANREGNKATDTPVAANANILPGTTTRRPKRAAEESREDLATGVEKEEAPAVAPRPPKTARIEKDPAPAPVEDDSDESDDADGEASLRRHNPIFTHASCSTLPPLNPATTNSTFNRKGVRDQAEVLSAIQAHFRHNEFKLQQGDAEGVRTNISQIESLINKRFEVLLVADKCSRRFPVQ